MFTLLAFGVGILAGIYPALVMSGFKPSQYPEGKHWSGRRSSRASQSHDHDPTGSISFHDHLSTIYEKSAELYQQ